MKLENLKIAICRRVRLSYHGIGNSRQKALGSEKSTSMLLFDETCLLLPSSVGVTGLREEKRIFHKYKHFYYSYLAF